jgi:hypothetical protein
MDFFFLLDSDEGVLQYLSDRSYRFVSLQLTLMCYRILVASYTDVLTTLLFDPKGPTLKVTSEIKVGNNPSWLTVHPNDPTLVFTGLEVANGIVIALKFDENGNGTVVGQISSGGADPASLLATTDALIVGNVRIMRQLLTPILICALLLVLIWNRPGRSTVHLTSILLGAGQIFAAAA